MVTGAGIHSQTSAFKGFSFTHCCLARSPWLKRGKKKKNTEQRRSSIDWWFQAWHTAEGANCFWKKGSICSYAAPQKLSLPLISGYSHSSLYYLLFELVLEYIKWLVWFSGVRFLLRLQQYRLHLEFLILCQFKKGKVPDGERKNNGLVWFGGDWWGEEKEGGVAAWTSSALLIFALSPERGGWLVQIQRKWCKRPKKGNEEISFRKTITA